jgi:hypothetical protein
MNNVHTLPNNIIAKIFQELTKIQKQAYVVFNLGTKFNMYLIIFVLKFIRIYMELHTNLLTVGGLSLCN